MAGRGLASPIFGSAPAIESVDWLRNEHLPRFIEKFNHVDTRKRLGLYLGERVPENETNLTDTRNRVSLIIEYELARISNDFLAIDGISDLFWSYVVANRFPDLEVRDNSGRRTLRVEVKCIQSIAEEKAANFDTLVKDLIPESDFVVVFLWDWVYGDASLVAWDRAPKIHRSFVFHARSLAQLRDSYWLNKPPSDVGDGYQGFDLRFAVNSKNGIHAKEGGNYGKLMRVWQEGFAYRPKASPLIDDTQREHSRFKNTSIQLGARNLALNLLTARSSGVVPEEVSNADVESGFRLKGDVCMMLASALKVPITANLLDSLQVKTLVTMSDKYACKVYTVAEGTLGKPGSVAKPKELLAHLANLP